MYCLRKKDLIVVVEPSHQNCQNNCVSANERTNWVNKLAMITRVGIFTEVPVGGLRVTNFGR